MKKILFVAMITAISSMFFSCEDKASNIKAIGNFKVNNYLGKWYEIARLDHRFERGLSNTTAHYSLRKDGKIKVVNKGQKEDGSWSSAEGEAKFKSDSTKGALKVSFFGPFYGGYNIVSLDNEYQNALVLGDNSNYCWFLSRKTSMSKEVKERFIHIADSLGVETENLIFVKHK